MTIRYLRTGLLAPLALLACCLAGPSALAQGGGKAAVPMYARLPARYLSNIVAPATATVPNWTGTLSPGGQSFVMVGTDPSTTNTTTTVTVYLVPIRIILSPTANGGIYDPQHLLPNGNTVTQSVALSPIYNAGIDYVQGGVDLGNTQYIDAFQRGDFWSDVQTNTNYHILLNAVVLPEQTIFVPPASGSTATEFGVKAALVDINFFDAKWEELISANPTITPDSFPVALLYDTYLTQGGGCCIGGYHSAFGSASAPQTYAQFTYVDKVGAFSQDVSALSHETGEWLADPFVDTPGCGGLLEIGDPLEGETNFGGFPYTLNGFTYNLQDMVFMQYFGQSPSTSVNGWWSFQNASLSQCSNGQ